MSGHFLHFLRNTVIGKPAAHPLLVLMLLTATHLAAAQSPSLPLKRPADEQLELPAFETEEQTPPLDLPRLPEPSQDKTLSERPMVFVREIRLQGNTVFSNDDLAGLIKPYEHREITSGELQELRYALTLHYINRGYINSGAIIPDQTVTDGIVTLQIIEGELSAIDVSGNERLRSDYISGRIGLGAGPPLNIVKLGEQLQILQQNPRFERINATLEPGAKPGESRLLVDVEETQPYHLWIDIDNHQPPSVGSYAGRVRGTHQDLTGRGDTLGFEFGKAQGLNDFSASYAIPLNARDTTLGLYYAATDSEVVEAPFDALDIESEEETFSLSLTQPFRLSISRTFTLGLSLDLRRNETFLLGTPFAFTSGTDNGETRLTVLRFSQEWLDRGRDRVLAARSMFSTGLDAFDATASGEPQDGEFFAWLGQFQLAQRIGTTNAQFIFRTDVQAANNGLPPMEQFTVGGSNTVRGYRENRLVADTGITASVELRIPVFAGSAGAARFQLAPFIDFGKVGNRFGDDPDPGHIASAGLGLIGTLSKRIGFEIYYGHAFQDFNDPEDDLQDDGLSFSITAQLL